jgi:hypothetical protein
MRVGPWRQDSAFERRMHMQHVHMMQTACALFFYCCSSTCRRPCDSTFLRVWVCCGGGMHPLQMLIGMGGCP